MSRNPAAFWKPAADLWYAARASIHCPNDAWQLPILFTMKGSSGSLYINARCRWFDVAVCSKVSKVTELGRNAQYYVAS